MATIYKSPNGYLMDVAMALTEQSVFRAVADPTRRQILAMLSATGMGTNAIAGQFAASRPAIIKHLKILRAAGLVSVERQGRNCINRLEPRRLKLISDWVATYDRLWDERLERLKLEVEKPHEIST